MNPLESLNDAFGGMIGNATESVQGNQVANGIGDTDDVQDLSRKLSLDSEQHAILQREMANRAGRDQMKLAQVQTSFIGPVLNQAQNLNTERQMALNAQENAARMAGEHLSNLSQARQTAANMIGQTGQTLAGAFR